MHCWRRPPAASTSAAALATRAASSSAASLVTRLQLATAAALSARTFARALAAMSAAALSTRAASMSAAVLAARAASRSAAALAARVFDAGADSWGGFLGWLHGAHGIARGRAAGWHFRRRSWCRHLHEQVARGGSWLQALEGFSPCILQSCGQ